MQGLNDAEGRPRPIREIERDAIVNAVSYAKGRMTSAARLLGVGRSTLYRKMAEHCVEYVPAPDPDPVEGTQAKRLPPGTFGSPEANAALLEILRSG